KPKSPGICSAANPMFMRSRKAMTYRRKRNGSRRAAIRCRAFCWIWSAADADATRPPLTSSVASNSSEAIGPQTRVTSKTQPLYLHHAPVPCGSVLLLARGPTRKRFCQGQHAFLWDTRPVFMTEAQPQISPHISIPRRRWGIALLLGLGVLVNYFDRVNLSVSRDALQASFGISAVMFGYLSS